MALRRGLVARERIAARVALLLRVLAEPLELLRRVARRRPDRRIDGEEKRACRDGDSREHGRRDPALRESEHDETERERGERGACVRKEQRDVEQERQETPPPSKRPADDVDQRDDERVRAGERREERRDEPPDGVVLVARVEHPVLGQAGEALVVEPELLAVPTGDAGVAPRLQRDEREVGESDHRHDDRRHRDQAADPAALLPRESGQPAERIRGDGKEVMTKCEQLPARGRLAAEHVLRDRPVHDDHRGVGHREHVGRLDRREVPRVPRDEDERNEEERLLPGGDHIERRSPYAEVP